MRTLVRAAVVIAAVLAAALSCPAPVYAQREEAPRFEVRLLAQSALVRSALGPLIPSERTVPQYGLELALPSGWAPLRLAGRVLRSPRGEADLRSRDVGVVIGGRALALAAAYGDRGSYEPASGLPNRRNVEFARVGGRVRWRLLDSGFHVHLDADHYMPLRTTPDPADALRGWEGASGLTYRASFFPVTATLGYRVERFRIYGLEQQVSALTFALGATIGER